MLRIIFFFVSVLFSVHVFATAQVPDYLIYKGKKLRLDVNPLEELFLKKKELRPEIVTISSSNWRGYIATFSIKERFLTVTDITINQGESVLLKVFPNEPDRKVDWFSGLLVIPLGKQTGYVHLSYASQYQKYLLIRVKNGLVLESSEMKLEEYLDYKVLQFEKFKLTSEYKALYKELNKGTKPNNLDIEKFIFRMGGFTHKIDIPFNPPNK